MRYSRYAIPVAFLVALAGSGWTVAGDDSQSSGQTAVAAEDESKSSTGAQTDSDAAGSAAMQGGGSGGSHSGQPSLAQKLEKECGGKSGQVFAKCQERVLSENPGGW